MYKLKIISSSVRPTRKGPVVAKWIGEVAKQYGSFDVEVLDLGEINLPMMDEPHHPVLRKYEHGHTKKWSAVIDEADAFIFVTAEYDFNYPAPLRNALEYLVQEWACKAAGIVSYGGISAGTRAYNSLKNDLASLMVITMATAVHLPFFTQYINEQGEFIASEKSVQAANTMLKEIVKWTKGLKIIKEDN